VQYQHARQQQRMVALSQQVQAFENQMSAMRGQISAFERRQAAQASQVSSWGNTLTGITATTDPLNGATRDVWTGPNSGYWMNGVGGGCERQRVARGGMAAAAGAIGEKAEG